MQKIDLSKKDEKALKSLLKKYIDAGKTYNDFSSNRKDAYFFTSTVGVRACPYCNINYTYTAASALRPDIDHFEPKYKETALALDLKNLIPCCQQCNSRVKLRKPFKQSTHIHPYHHDFNSIIRFSIDLNSPEYLSSKSFKIQFVPRQNCYSDHLAKANNSIVDLKLTERYQHHKVDVIDLFKKAKHYHKARINEIEDLVGAKELEAALFSHRQDDINQAPLSKLTNDILDIIL